MNIVPEPESVTLEQFRGMMQPETMRAVFRDLNHEYLERATLAQQGKGPVTMRGFFDMMAALCLTVVKAENVQTRTFEMLLILSTWKYDMEQCFQGDRKRHIEYALARITQAITRPNVIAANTVNVMEEAE